MKGYLGFLLDGDNRINSIRDKYDYLSGKVSAHISVVYPTEFEAVDLECVREVVANFKPIDVNLSEVTGSAENLLLLNVKQGNDSIIALHDVLYSKCFLNAYNPNFTYFPHTTVGRFYSNLEMRAALDNLANSDIGNPSYQTRLTTLSAVVITNTGERNLIDEFHLGG